MEVDVVCVCVCAYGCACMHACVCVFGHGCVWVVWGGCMWVFVCEGEKQREREMLLLYFSTYQLLHTLI